MKQRNAVMMDRLLKEYMEHIEQGRSPEYALELMEYVRPTVLARLKALIAKKAPEAR